MSQMTVDISRVDNDRIAAYLASTDRRVMIGFRFTLEVLGIPLPEFAERKPAGRPTPAKLMAQADADSGTIHTYRAEKRGTGPFAPRA
ncbi:hypothetical protein [Sphingobium sp. DN12]|uniref:hypothetical protein n=1 Tax=Sphingobium sp. DN12 TaxID=3378073 RepID=UPI003DA543B1